MVTRRIEIKPRVIYCNIIPTPYIVERLNAVADCGQLDFETWLNDHNEHDRSWSVDESRWRFRYTLPADFPCHGKDIALARSATGPASEIRADDPVCRTGFFSKVLVGKVAWIKTA